MFIYGAIQTTEAKAQALVSIIESLANTIITKPEITAKRELFRYLQNQTWVNNVVKTFKETFGEQSSNFTQIDKVKRRYGDDSLIVKLSFVKPVKFEVGKKVRQTIEELGGTMPEHLPNPEKSIKQIEKEQSKKEIEKYLLVFMFL